MDWLQIVVLLGALILVAPAAWKIIRGRPDLALKSVVFWLGVAVMLGYLYTYTGVGAWWEARHGGSLRPSPIGNADINNQSGDDQPGGSGDDPQPIMR